MYLETNTGERYRLRLFPTKGLICEGLEGVFWQSSGFFADIPLQADLTSIKILLCLNKKTHRYLQIKWGNYAKLSPEVPHHYYCRHGWALTATENELHLQPASRTSHIRLEMQYLAELVKCKEYSIFFYRLCYSLLHSFIRKQIWIISDRTNKAGDNGESLFKYLSTHEKKAKVYFTVDKNTPDYKRLQAAGKVLPFGSFRYKLNFLFSSKVISSHANAHVTNAFGDKKIYMKDLYSFRYVSLQHGITQGDLSSWLSKFNKNISLFITACKKEQASILHGLYAYNAKEVQLTGMPRYDYLTDHAQKIILIAPTWRSALIPKADAITGIHPYSESFKATDYCRFYNALINDSRLLEAMKEAHYTAHFVLHPSLVNYLADFHGNEYVTVTNQANYNKEFSEASLMVTDYSSVAFDFAYLRKPIIYSQFDRDTFFAGHIYSHMNQDACFDYEKDGFGPICCDYESTVQAIIQALEGGCVLEDQYRGRINAFFAFDDQNNCSRVHQALQKLK